MTRPPLPASVGDSATLPPAPAPASVGDAVTVGPTPATVDVSQVVPPPGFVVERELGRGGMGVVYLARQAGLNRPVALKMVLGSGTADPKQLIRFLAEAEAVAAVRHANVVEVYQYGEHAGRPFLAMEYCPGGSLADGGKDGPMVPSLAAEVLAGVAAGVAAAHAAGIVHRDLKPGNVLLAGGDVPKVTDFGLAKKTAGETELTRTNAVMGTPAYMAPEQAQGGTKFVGPAADVWALGVMLYELLTGGRPFRGDDTFSLLAVVMKGEFDRPRKRVPGVPRDLELICLKCLEMDPGRRYPTAAELAADLRAYLDGRPIAARPPSAREQVWRWVKRHPAAGAVAGVVLAAVGAVLGVLASANASLTREKEAADQARAEAVARGEEADRERAKAQARLAKAVEGIEKVAVRVSTAKWGRDRSLAAERRAVLEDVVAYYEGFGEATDPVVRRETARAYRRIGNSYLDLTDYPKAADYLGRSRDLLERLVADFPDDPAPAAELAETLLIRTYHAATVGRNDELLPGYRAAAAAARRALAGRPADDDTRRTLAECLAQEGVIATFVDKPTAARVFGEAERLADELMARPDPPYATRAVAAFVTSMAATLDFNDGRPAAGRKRLDRSAAVLAATPPDPAAPARYVFLVDATAGMVERSFASIRFGEGKRTEAAEAARRAVAIWDRLLAVSPNVAYYLREKLIALAIEVEILDHLGREADATARRADLFATADRLAAVSPDDTMNAMGVIIRAQMLATQAKGGPVADLDRQAADLLAAARKLGPAGVNPTYNVACALSLGSRHGTAAEREARAAKAVRVLVGLVNSPATRDPARVAHLDRDTDLDPVRDRDDYAAFRAKLPGRPPPPVAPMPRLRPAGAARP